MASECPGLDGRLKRVDRHAHMFPLQRRDDGFEATNLVVGRDRPRIRVARCRAYVDGVCTVAHERARVCDRVVGIRPTAAGGK